MSQLGRRIQVYVTKHATAAGSSNVDGHATTTLDTYGFDGTLWVGVFGTGSTGGNNSFSVNGSTVSTSTGNTLTGATATNTGSSSGTVDYFVIDVYRPAARGYRFLTGVQSAASSCEAMGPVLAFLYGANIQAPSTNLGGPALAGSTAGGVRTPVFAVSPTT